jgi:sirohydrochlorin ferrochelatase
VTQRLVVAAHGTVSARGRSVVETCAAHAADLLGVPAQVGYVDVCGPTLADALDGGSGEGGEPVVVPLFLASGYHVRHDVPAAVAHAPGAVVTAALGTAPAVIDALEGRLRQALGEAVVADHVDGLVLASAGSTQDDARAEVAQVAALLADRVGVPTEVAYLSGPGARIGQACSAHRATGRSRIAVATHLLAPGVFLARARRQAAEAGTVAVTDELATHPAISALVAARYSTAVRPEVA